MIRILHIPTNGFCLDGILRFICTYASDMPEAAMDVAVWGDISEDAAVSARKAGLRLRRLPERVRELSSYVPALYRLMRDGKYDIVHVHGSSGLMAVELFTALLAGIPVRIAHSHADGCRHRVLDRMLRPLLYLSATERLACGRNAGRFLFPGMRFHRIPNAIDLDAWMYDVRAGRRWRADYGVRDGELVLVCVGNFYAWKNHKFLIGLMGGLDARLVLVGDGPERDVLEKYVKERGLSGKVIFTGSIRDVASVLSAADIFCLPSFREGFPISLLEAQASGLRCVVSSCVDSAVKLTGATYQIPLDTKKWTDFVRYLSSQKYDRDVMSREACGILAHKGYSMKGCGRRLYGFYRKAL